MPADAPLTLDACDSLGNGLRLRLFWQADRYAHEIFFVRGGIERLALRSVEGNSEQHWPPSPPFQQATLHAMGEGRRAALLVGMAGKSHWSASIEADAASRRMTFDLACRLGESAPKLGNEYDALLKMDGDDRAARSSRDHETGDAMALTIVSGAVLRAANKAAVFIDAGSHSAPGTVRWRYAIAWSAGQPR